MAPASSASPRFATSTSCRRSGALLITAAAQDRAAARAALCACWRWCRADDFRSDLHTKASGALHYENQQHACGRGASLPLVASRHWLSRSQVSRARPAPRPRSAASSYRRPIQLRRGDQGEGLGIEGVVGAARRAAGGCAQRAADHDGRCRLRRAVHLRRGHPDAGPGPHREAGAALHELPLDFALLADAGGADHRPQPPCGRLWGRGRDGDGLPRLQLDHPEGERHDRHAS